MKIYTCSGDDGTTSLSGGRRIQKHHKRVEAYGTVDELIAWIGLLRDHRENLKRKELLLYIQDQLMRCAAVLASETDANISGILPFPDSVLRLEKEIDIMQKGLKPLKNFVLPGGNILVSYCHITRCVCRRAERVVSGLNEQEFVPSIILKLLNRLSDFLFVLARKTSSSLDIEEVTWRL